MRIFIVTKKYSSSSRRRPQRAGRRKSLLIFFTTSSQAFDIRGQGLAHCGSVVVHSDEPRNHLNSALDSNPLRRGRRSGRCSNGVARGRHSLPHTARWLSAKRPLPSNFTVTCGFYLNRRDAEGAEGAEKIAKNPRRDQLQAGQKIPSPTLRPLHLCGSTFFLRDSAPPTTASRPESG